MLKKLKEIKEVLSDPMLLIMDPRLYFPICGIVICIIVLLNQFVFYKFDGKINETTAVVAVVREVSEQKNYTLRIDETNQEFQYKLSKEYSVGESVKGYYDGTHFLTEKQAKKRGIVPVLIWTVPLSILLFGLIWGIVLGVVKTSLGSK